MPHPTTFFIRPREGLRIADPQTGEYLPESGMLMPRSGFWLRRLKDGDVVEVRKGAPTPAASQTVTPEPAPESVQETAGQGKKKKE